QRSSPHLPVQSASLPSWISRRRNPTAKAHRSCPRIPPAALFSTTLAGGALENAPLAMRFLAANEDVTVIIPGMADAKEIEQNLAAVENTAPLSEEELAEMDKIRNELGTQFCRRCNYCQPCAAGINISSVFLMQGYLNRYGLADWARSRYETFPKKASDCIQCGLCESRCPYNLPIREMLKKAAVDFGK
ncbi:MAG: 4Fe-4S dicluster domain-containing protein, partial [Clostridia bacterium]|nr:4Fe-4S dicluster domain-containing protein [Clostridia bacterium]